MSSDGLYANRHIPAFKAFCSDHDDGVLSSSAVQLVQDGTQLTAASLKEGKLDISRPILVSDKPESIGMTVFKTPTPEDKVTVRMIADAVAIPHLPVRVMDVEHQEELKGWTLGDLVDYFEDEDRLRCHQQKQEKGESSSSSSTNDAPVMEASNRKRRKAAEKAINLLLSETSKPRILNQISLEFSRTALGQKVKSPQFVRDLDWIANHWPREQRQEMPSVQYYCLTSAEGCYTDFHCDFGGSSVYYHVLSGAKMFILIKPTPQNLSIYEQWLGHPEQETIFLPDKIPNPQDNVIAVHLPTSQTLFIPTGWIHAVYTPEDAVVLGGNFLHGCDMGIQVKISEIEQRTKVPTRFQFPYFRKIHFYTAGMYLQKLRTNKSHPHHHGLAKAELSGMPHLIKALEKWYGEAAAPTVTGNMEKGNDGLMEAALYAASLNGYDSISDFLGAMWKEYEAATKQGGPDEDEEVPLPNNNRPKQGLSIKLALTSASPRGNSNNPLGSPKSPKIRLSLNSAIRTPNNKPNHDSSNSNNNNNTQGDETFRIVISSVAKETHEPLPRVKRNPRTERLREDIREYVDVSHADDDEWVPAPSRRKSSSAGSKRKTNAPCLAAMTAHGQSHTKNGRAAPATKKTKTTARQRLLKKFR